MVISEKSCDWGIENLFKIKEILFVEKTLKFTFSIIHDRFWWPI